MVNMRDLIIFRITNSFLELKNNTAFRGGLEKKNVYVRRGRLNAVGGAGG
jgi:hypothetical protein